MARRSVASEGAVPDRTSRFVVGGAAGGALLLSAAAALGALCRRKFRSSSSAAAPPPPPPGSFPRIPSTNAVAPPAATTGAPGRERVVTIPSTEGDDDDDVSALQGPGGAMIGAAGPRADGTVGGSDVSSAHRGYVWELDRERLDDAGGSTATGGAADARFAEDRSFEGIYRIPHGACDGGASGGAGEAPRTFVVAAPPGKLGIVVDNPTGDAPFVRAVGDASALRGRVRAGDLLLSVDGIDCRGMSAARVSALISERSDNPSRTLVLCRGSVSC